VTEDTFAKIHRVLCEAKEEYEQPQNKREEGYTGSTDGSAVYHARTQRLAPKTMASNATSAEVVRGER